MCLCQTAISQVSFGVQGGASFFKLTSIEVSPELDRRFSHGYYAALVADISIKNNFSIQGELSIVRKGDALIAKEPNAYTIPIPNDWRSEVRATYLELPIMAKYNFGFGNKTGLELGMGVSAGYLLEVKMWTRSNGETSSEILEITDEYNINGVKSNRWDVAPIVDVAVPLKTSFGDIKMGLRGSFDLTDINSYQDNSIAAERNTYNWGMIFYGGYTISKKHFGKKTKSSDVM